MTNLDLPSLDFLFQKMTDKEVFSYLAEFAEDHPEDLRKLVGHAMTLKTIEDIIAENKDGWLGVKGQFARVVARCISQVN